MRKMKLSEKKMKQAKRDCIDNMVIKERTGLRDGKTAAETVIVTRTNAHGIESVIPRFQVKDTITEAQKKKLERSGIRIVTVDAMVKRREKNITAFRNMGKPGYAVTGEVVGKIK